MQARADAAGVALRPHAKTHKSARVAALQHAAGARGLTVGTLGEAEVFADAGFDDLFLAYTVWASDAKAGRRPRPPRAARPPGRHRLGRGRRGARPGRRRVDPPARRPRRARQRRTPGRRPTRRGASRSLGRPTGPACGRSASTPTAAIRTPVPTRSPRRRPTRSTAVSRAADALRAAGFEISVLSVGSTPTASLPAVAPGHRDPAGDVRLPGPRPGLARVVRPRRHRVLGRDDRSRAWPCPARPSSTPAPRRSRETSTASAPGLGLLPTLPGLLRAVNDYHGFVDPPGADRGRLGEVLPIAPNHVCPVVDHHAETVVVRDGRVVDVWPVDARGRSR